MQQPKNSRMLLDETVENVSPEELEQLRKKAEELLENDNAALRSCWNCNPAHQYLVESKDCVYKCFECGRVYLEGVDVSIYDESSE